LAGDFAGFHGDRVLAPLEGLGDFVENAHGYLLCVSVSMRGMQAIPPEPGANITVHDAIPEKLRACRNCFGMTQLRSVFVVSEVKNA
jgi:hypothetical protein